MKETPLYLERRQKVLNVIRKIDKRFNSTYQLALASGVKQSAVRPIVKELEARGLILKKNYPWLSLDVYGRVLDDQVNYQIQKSKELVNKWVDILYANYVLQFKDIDFWDEMKAVENEGTA